MVCLHTLYFIVHSAGYFPLVKKMVKKLFILHVYILVYILAPELEMGLGTPDWRKHIMFISKNILFA